MTDRTVFLLTFTEEYSVGGAVALESALRHCQDRVSVTIGTVDLGEASARRLRRIAARHGTELSFEDMSDRVRLFPQIGRYPPLAWTRTLAAEIVPPRTTRAIYLDADVLVRGPMGELVAVELGGSGLGAVVDAAIPTLGERGLRYVREAGSHPRSPYFNSGVLVIDPISWSELRVRDRVLELVRRREVPLDFIDQDALNIVFADRWHVLDATWNTLADEPAADARIVQFSSVKPWEASAAGPFVEEFKEVEAAIS